jgi:hypothetical protein
LPPIYDGNPGTDFVLQASVEIPWFYSVADPVAPAGVVPGGQVVLFAYEHLDGLIGEVPDPCGQSALGHGEGLDPKHVVIEVTESAA